MAKKWEEARAAREVKLDGLQERLTGAVETLVSGADWQRAMNFAARFRSRSFNNTLGSAEGLVESMTASI